MLLRKLVNMMYDFGQLSDRFGRRSAASLTWQYYFGSRDVVLDTHEGPLNLGREPGVLRYFWDSVPKVQRLVDAIPEDGIDVVFDVGANVGVFSMFAARRWPAARIFSFEPAPEVQRALSLNLGNASGAEIVQKAVTNVVGEASFTVNPDALQTSSLFANAVQPFTSLNTTRTIRVPTTTVDTFCKERGISGIDVLKIDVQGAETLVLQGAQSMLHHVRHVLLEVSFLDSSPCDVYRLAEEVVGASRVVNLVSGGADLCFSKA